MKKEHEILIQKKVDGQLSTTEEDKFDKLISQSAEANKYYNEIKKVDELLISDATRAKTIDNTHSIMNSIGKSNVQHTKTKTRLFTPRLMKYAAILIVGVFMGAAFSYTFFNSAEIDNTMLSGTMVSKTNEQVLFEDEQTKIVLHTIDVAEIKIALLRVETNELINCEITNTGHEHMQIVALKNKANLSENAEINNQLTITGNTIFQVIFNSQETPELLFVRENKIIARKKIE
ncbi:MAG: hypothetical protein JXR50_11920 [Prolixibacteraceae bacterium]|nr:hypothetical protein [Prolixibacteraceae bacterium]MBN2650438.1 hypothetical protein [Prolixibacteraceae bacterium]